MSVKYSFEDHIINRQAEAEEAMLREFEAGCYTLSNPLVKYNAYLVNPLAAVVCFNTEEEVAVTVTVLGKTPQGNISHTFPKAKDIFSLSWGSTPTTRTRWSCGLTGGRAM